MTDKPAGTGQWKKLIYNKVLSDTTGVTWRLSTWKVLFWMIAILVLLIIIYSFFVDDQTSFLKDVIFYGIITTIVIAIVWVLTNLFWKGRRLFTGFLLAWILIFSFYVVLGAICSYINWMDFHFGFSVWLIITCLASLGAKRIDGNLDKHDLGFGLLVFIVLIMGNVPVFEVGGFYAQVDTFVGWIAERLSFINPQEFIAT